MMTIDFRNTIMKSSEKEIQCFLTSEIHSLTFLVNSEKGNSIEDHFRKYFSIDFFFLTQEIDFRIFFYRGIDSEIFSIHDQIKNFF